MFAVSAYKGLLVLYMVYGGLLLISLYLLHNLQHMFLFFLQKPDKFHHHIIF